MSRPLTPFQAQVLLLLVQDGGTYGCIARISQKLNKHQSQVSLAMTSIRGKYGLLQISNQQLARELKWRI